MLRAFIAIQLSDELRRQIGSVQDELRRGLAKIGKIGWTSPAGIHVTLKFLGDIPESQIQPLQELLAQAAASARPFTLEARGLGAFPNLRAPRVLWIGLHGSEADMEALRGLQVMIENGTSDLGFQKEARAFAPHLTLARLRERVETETLGKVLAANQNRAVGALAAASVALIRSELRPSGAVYTTLVEVPFGGGV
jgi:RNA 2',3'-cyclic 3'-phosphodiesterase